MEEEDEDKLLLSSLGVTSANQEDLERKFLSKVNKDTIRESESGENLEDLELDGEHETDIKLYDKLRAIEFEINAVASSIEKAGYVKEIEKCGSGNTNIGEDKGTEDGNDSVQVTANGLTLQQALATDRLRSLKRKKAQLEKEISNEIGHEKFLEELVKEKPKRNLKLKKLKQSPKDSKKRLKTVSFTEDADFDAVLDASRAGFIETERDEMVRKGILTPFHKLQGFERRVQQPRPSSMKNDPEEGSTGNFATNSFAKVAQSLAEIARSRPTTKLLDAKDLPRLEAPTHPFQRLRTPMKLPVSPSSENMKNKKQKLKKAKRPLPDKKWRTVDSRLEKMTEGSDRETRGDSFTSENEEEHEEEIESAHDEEQASVILEGGLRIPHSIYTKLFDYQKVGVQWLWELHCQRAGGIIGDEMGLGKTIQVLSFLAALHFSKMYKPSIVICPVTLLRQWQREAQKWYPQFRVEILHESAHGTKKQERDRKSSETDENSEGSSDIDIERPSLKRWDNLIDRAVTSESGLLLTTYEQLRILGDKLLDVEWGYAVLDEGHRIKNPNAEVTLACKQLQTVHRVIMTGAPIQNKLTELWSLFDFVFPGKLGVMPVFEKEFAVPISVGGYANATPLQVSTAYRCAVVLRDLIMPYLLRRMKNDVNAHLPKKTEHVLFCSLTLDQRSVYRAFLASSEVEQIFDGRRNSLYGIDVMRKICNHPDLLEREHSANNPDYGNPERSGKMKVVGEVLKVWKEQGNRVLLFSQTQQMLDILEGFLISNGYSYRRMDGSTPAKLRMALIDEFNNSVEVFVFILTTKVGGLGTNLTGANRVIIFDPDWNPSTDMQARERAWRIGQTLDVTVYRLITRGTIEEKVYHRQIYKHFLTNKILKNPQQRRFFKARDMKDLFILQDDQDGGSTETSNIFSQLSNEMNIGDQKNYQDSQGSSSLSKENLSSVLKASTSSTEAKEHTHESKDEVNEEMTILKTLFDAHGLHSAMNHDAIVNANDNDKMRMEEQASLVAQRAAEALRESRMLRSRESFAVPTWTGRSGAAGAPSAVHRRFGSIGRQTEGPSSSRPPVPIAGVSTGKALSSADLLARVRGTREIAVTPVSDALEHRETELRENNRSKIPHRLTRAQPEVLIRQLCTFIQQRGGASDSAAITQQFKDRLLPADLPLFKNLLKQIATLEKDADGSRWVLKPDYRQQDHDTVCR